MSKRYIIDKLFEVVKARESTDSRTLGGKTLEQFKEAVEGLEDFYPYAVEVGLEFLSGRQKQSWDFIDTARLAQQYQKLLKDEPLDTDFLDETIFILRNNIGKILANSMYIYYPTGVFQLMDEELDAFSDFIADEYGNCRATEAPEKFEKALRELTIAKTDRQKLVAINNTLDIVHGIGEVAYWFVKGGKITLDKLSGKLQESNLEDKARIPPGFEFLVKEAKKYKSAEEFVEAQAKKITEKMVAKICDIYDVPKIDVEFLDTDLTSGGGLGSFKVFRGKYPFIEIAKEGLLDNHSLYHELAHYILWTRKRENVFHPVLAHGEEHDRIMCRIAHFLKPDYISRSQLIDIYNYATKKLNKTERPEAKASEAVAKEE